MRIQISDFSVKFKAKNITQLPVLQRGKWFFRVSVCEYEKSDAYSVMITLWNLYQRNRMYIRFFTTNEDAAAFVDECVAGKYGDSLEPTEE